MGERHETSGAESVWKVIGKKGKPTEEEILKMNPKKKKAYDKSMEKCQKLAMKKYMARQKKLKLARAKQMTKMAKMMGKKK
mgnify:FL=1